MSWTITKDHIAEPGGINRRDFGSDSTSVNIQEALIGIKSEPLPTGERIPFRLFDDDGELYYEGVLDDDPECINQSEALRFGELDAGCTTIKVLRGDEWVQDIG